MTSSSTSGATGDADPGGVISEPSTVHPNWLISIVSGGGCCLSAAFHRSNCKWALSTCSIRFASVGGNFLRGGGFFFVQKMRTRASFIDLHIVCPYRGKKKASAVSCICSLVTACCPRTLSNPGISSCSILSADCFPLPTGYDTVSHPDIACTTSSWLHFLGPRYLTVLLMSRTDPFHFSIWILELICLLDTQYTSRTKTSVSSLRIRMVLVPSSVDFSM